MIALTLGVSFGMIIGPDAGLVSHDTAEVLTNWLALPGNLFLQIVKMIIIPLIFSSIIIGIASSGDPNFIKKVGPRLALYFVMTTIAATLIGFGTASLIQPGKYIDVQQIAIELDTAQPQELSIVNIPGKIVDLLPSNPLESMVNGDMLGIVLFTVIIGVSLLFVKKDHLDLMLNILITIQEISMTVIKWAMALVPLAVFGLMTKITSQIGISSLAGLGMYILTVLVGLFVMVLFYLLILTLFTKQKPLNFLRAIRPAQLLAFSTSSSAAVIPLSMRTAEEKLKVDPALSQFLIPVGATINMDGTALYQVVATVFLAQAFGVSLPFISVLLVIAVTVGASIGAPSAPGVGIVILATILSSVGIPASGIALIIGVDRILDMSRTAVNVTGDLTACSFFNKRIPLANKA